MTTRRTLRQQLDQARARAAELATQRDEALKAAGTERFNVKRLAGQVSEVRDERDALQQKLEAERPAPSEELRRARRALLLERNANEQLTRRLEQLQAANEAMCREAVDRAGTLARREVRTP